MQMRALVLGFAAVVLAGCPSKDPTPPDATSSSGSSSAALANGNGTGPLANLEGSPYANEVWIGDGGAQVPMLYYAQQNVRLSASCKPGGAMGGGALSCDAIRYLRNGTPIEMPHRALDGRTSAGVKVCTRLNDKVVVLRNSVGSEDSACQFPDGSLVSTGALEQYGMRVTEP